MTTKVKSNMLSAFGYETGVGGTVTQGTSKSTAVTLHKLCGQITMHNASLSAGASVGFVFYNDTIGANDIVLMNATSAFNNYSIRVGVGSTAASVVITNETGSPLSEAVVLNFTVIKGVAS